MLRFFRKLYVPTSPTVSSSNPYDLVIAAEYAGLDDPENILPDATKKGVRLAALHFKQGSAREIAWGNSERPGPGSATLHAAKLKLLMEFGISADHVVSTVSNNTIQEVQRICEARPEARRILIVCDEPHARRYRRIVRYFNPRATADVLTFRATWNEGHPSPWQKSSARWWFMNLLYHGLMFVGRGKFISRFINKIHINQ